MKMSHETEYCHTVFKNNPIHLSSFIDQYVSINTKYNVKLTGFVDAIDPVSECVILSTCSEGKIVTAIVMGHGIDKIVISQPTSDCTPRPKVLNEIPDTDNAARKLEVLSWLSKNLLPVKEVNESLEIHNGTLSILPPYYSENCISSNAIILGRIQHLLNNMPKIDIS